MNFTTSGILSSYERLGTYLIPLKHFLCDSIFPTLCVSIIHLTNQMIFFLPRSKSFLSFLFPSFFPPVVDNDTWTITNNQVYEYSRLLVASTANRITEHARRRMLDTGHRRELRSQGQSAAQAKSPAIRATNRRLQILRDTTLCWTSHVRRFWLFR